MSPNVPTPQTSNAATVQNNFTPLNNQLLNWDLDIVKDRVSRGVPITDMVADIGNDMVVKYGCRVRPEEARAIQVVATKTSGIPVPRVYGVIRDHDTSITYIVQEKLKGTPLVDLLPTLSELEFDVVADQLRDILRALSSLDTAGPMGTFGHNHYNFVFHRFTAYGDWVTPTTKEFVERLPKLLAASPLSFSATDRGSSGGPYDFGRNPIFSHGDFVPENILIHEGRVSGIIDWEHAGWYPYFWNDYVARRRMKLPKFRDGKWQAMVEKIMASYPSSILYLR
ncbi:kinase-like protein [Hymenopellis radicata]|nr:kinase-like protein [Hymenopellis radicata]